MVRSAYLRPSLISDAAQGAEASLRSIFPPSKADPAWWIWIMGSGQCIVASVIRADSLSIVMRYNINSRRVIRNNIAHSGCQMSYFCCIMDYLSGISWPFLVPTYPRVLPIFTVLPLVNTPQSSPVIGPIIRGRHDIIRIDITNIPIPNYKGVFPHLHARHSWIISTKLQSGSMWLIPKIAEGSILDFIFRDTEYWVLTVRIISPGSHLRQVEGWEHESSPA